MTVRQCADVHTQSHIHWDITIRTHKIIDQSLVTSLGFTHKTNAAKSTTGKKLILQQSLDYRFVPSISTT